jgi:hypothetical protein
LQREESLAASYLYMADETSPEQIERVKRLAEAINEKKHVENDESHSIEDREHADEEVNGALEEVRSHKASR